MKSRGPIWLGASLGIVTVWALLSSSPAREDCDPLAPPEAVPVRSLESPRILGPVADAHSVVSREPESSDEHDHFHGLAGTVQDSDGNGITGALVRWEFGEAEWHTLSGTLGSFRLPDLPSTTGQLRVSAAGFLPSSRSCDAEGRVKIVLASPSASLTGIVRSARSGLPVPGAQIRVAESHQASCLASAQTDQAGRFSLLDLPAGVLSVAVGHAEFESLTRLVRMEGETRSEFVLEDAPVLDVQVVDRSTGFPLEGATLSDGRFEVRTEWDGWSRIPVSSHGGRRTLVRVARKGYVVASRAFADASGTPVKIELVPDREFAICLGLEDLAADVNPLVTFSQEPSPCEKVTRRATLQRLENGSGWLARASGFAPDRPVHASACAPGYVTDRIRAQPLEEPATSLPFLVLARGTVTKGVVRDPGGHVVAGARLFVADLERDVPSGVQAFDEAWEASSMRSVTDDEGRFILTIDPRAACRILLHSVGRPLAELSLDPGIEADLRVEDYPGQRGTIHGVVRSSALPRVEVVSVVATNESGDMWFAVSEPDGAFTFHDLPAGRYRLVATGQGATDRVVCYSRGTVSPGAECVFVEAR